MTINGNYFSAEICNTPGRKKYQFKVNGADLFESDHSIHYDLFQEEDEDFIKYLYEEFVSLILKERYQ